MGDTQLFELHMEAAAEVRRACCGGDHEFGQCPLAAPVADQKEEEPR